MNQVKETLVGFLCAIGIYTVIVEIVGVIFSENILFYTLGLLFGVMVAVLLFIHMAKTLDRALDLPQTQATKYMKRQSFLRLFIMLAAMVVGLLFSYFNFIAVFLGLLGLKIGALLAPVFLKRIYPESYITKEETDVNEKEVEDSE